VWLIQDGETIDAIIDEIGDTRSWTFYWCRNGDWVELIEFGSHNNPVEGIVPRFGEIVEYAYTSNPSHSCLMVRENTDGTIWWLLYYRLGVGVYH
jgi:hypothetical protein